MDAGQAPPATGVEAPTAGTGPTPTEQAPADAAVTYGDFAVPVSWLAHDCPFPYFEISEADAVENFRRLLALGVVHDRRIAQGNKVVHFGTEKMRQRTRYRGNPSNVQRWTDLKARRALLALAARVLVKKKLPRWQYRSILYHCAMPMQWNACYGMRPMMAMRVYEAFRARRVVDFCAGWGARLVGALARNIDYVGIDTNPRLRQGYNKICAAVGDLTTSRPTFMTARAEEVSFEALAPYDLVFTSPPFEYLEVYDGMTIYDGQQASFKKPAAPSSAHPKPSRTNPQYYAQFLTVAVKNAYEHLSPGGTIALNLPEEMHVKLSALWKPATSRLDFSIARRVNPNEPASSRRRNVKASKQIVFCWKK